MFRGNTAFVKGDWFKRETAEETIERQKQETVQRMLKYKRLKELDELASEYNVYCEKEYLIVTYGNQYRVTGELTKTRNHVIVECGDCLTTFNKSDIRSISEVNVYGRK